MIVLAVLAVFFVGAAPALAWTDTDTAALRSILSGYRSPLPPWTIEAFAEG